MLAQLVTAAFAAILSTAICSALEPSRQISQYRLRSWTQAQGLPLDAVRALAQTPDGYLWVGTDEGLASFDGYSFVQTPPESLPSLAIRALCAASDGTLWIGTASGVTRYNDGRFAQVPEIGSTQVSAIAESPTGIIWIAAGTRLFRYSDSRFTAYGPENGLAVEGVRVVLPLEGEEILIAGYGAVASFGNGHTSAVSSTREMSGSVPTSLLRTSPGRLLAGGTKGLFERNPAGTWERLPAFGGFVRALARDRDDNIWVGTNSGLLRWRLGETGGIDRWERFAAGWIWCIFEDREGTLWIGANNGLHQLIDTPIAVYGIEEGLPSDEPAGVVEDSSGRVWTGFHNGGAGFFERGRFQHVLRDEEVLCIRRTRAGEILIGARSGLRRLSGGKVVWSYHPRDQIGRSNVFDVAEDSSGTLWLGTNGGLIRHDSAGAFVAAPGGTLLDDAVVTVLTARDGTVWAGTYGNGLWRVSRTDRARYTAAAGLPSDQIRALYEDDEGVIWIATAGGGLGFYRDGVFHTVPPAVLPPRNIGDILGDKDDLWLATTRGILKVNRAAMLGRDQSRSLWFTLEDGLRSANAAPGYPTSSGGARTSDGSVWFPTARGLAAISPAYRERAGVFPVHITEATVDGTEWDVARELPSDVRRIEFRYAAVHLAAPHSVRYRFRLEPVDRDWIETGDSRVATYSNLRRGEYRFRVAAAIAGSGKWIEAAPIRFRKQPAFYETWWFIGLMAGSVVLALWSGWRWRLRQERRRFAYVLDERSRIARELHDTLAQGYVGIVSQLGAAQATLRANPTVAADQLELARRMAQHSLTEARQSIADLRSPSLDGGNLEAAIRAAVQQITSAPVSFDFEPVPARLSPTAAHQLLRITLEAVTNSVKHAAPNHISIRLRQKDKTLRLTVSDDGRGFDPGKTVPQPGHFGLMGMRERAEAIGGSMDVQSEPGRGTTIEVQVPAP